MLRQNETQNGLERVYTSIPKASAAKTLHAGTVEIFGYHIFAKMFDYFFAKAEKQRKESEGKGYPRTSAVIMEIVVAALTCIGQCDLSHPNLSVRHRRFKNKWRTER